MAGPVITHWAQLSSRAQMEAVSFLQPWFVPKKGGGGAAVVNRDLYAVFDGIGAVIAVNAQGDVRLDDDYQILGWTLLADQVGSIEIDIWKDVYANYPPDLADSIVAAAPPVISSDDHSTDTSLTGWDTTINAGDCIRFNVDSVTDITRVNLILHLAEG